MDGSSLTLEVMIATCGPDGGRRVEAMRLPRPYGFQPFGIQLKVVICHKQYVAPGIVKAMVAVAAQAQTFEWQHPDIFTACQRLRHRDAARLLP